ncbi:MAG: O-antigen ligase family protein [Cyanobacteria bacterium P01_H01_bin.26]
MNKRYFAIGETAFAILGILFFAGSLSEDFIAELTGIGLGLSGTVASLMRYLLWLGSTLLLALRWRVTWSVARRDKLVWVVFGLSMLSFMWSQNPGFTSVVVREVLQMTTFGLYFASRFKLREQLYLIAFTLGSIAVISSLLAIALPSVGVDQEIFVGAWTGMYGHKNALGKYMSLSVLAFAVLAADSKFQINRLYYFLTWGGLCLSLALVVLTTSQTSLTVSLASILILSLYRLFQQRGNKRRLYFEVTFLLAFTIGLLIYSNWEMLLTSMGRDITLTGRTDIWLASLEELGKHPWFGFGRGTFWAPGSSLARIAGAAVGRKYIPPHAHNGYIDLALEIGYIGLFCFLGSFFITYRRAITRSFVSRAAKDIWPLAFLSWLAVYNFTESMLMYQENLYWPMYLTIALCARPSGQAIHLRLRRRYKQSAA